MEKTTERDDLMPSSAETIEILARKLERSRILLDLKACKTMDDLRELIEKYETLCSNDKQ